MEGALPVSSTGFWPVEDAWGLFYSARKNEDPGKMRLVFRPNAKVDKQRSADGSLALQGITRQRRTETSRKQHDYKSFFRYADRSEWHTAQPRCHYSRQAWFGRRTGARLATLVAPAGAEPGNINYDLHRSNDDPDVWILYENWKAPSDLATHFESS
jgi:hypothetical protein